MLAFFFFTYSFFRTLGYYFSDLNLKNKRTKKVYKKDATTQKTPAYMRYYKEFDQKNLSINY